VRWLTWDAPIAGFQVARQIRQTRSTLIHLRIWNSQLTLLASRTVPIQHVDDVGIATDEAEVDAHAATDAHAPVATGSYQDHVTVLAAGREFFCRTEVCRKVSANIPGYRLGWNMHGQETNVTTQIHVKLNCESDYKYTRTKNTIPRLHSFV